MENLVTLEKEVSSRNSDSSSPSLGDGALGFFGAFRSFHPLKQWKLTSLMLPQTKRFVAIPSDITGKVATCK